MSAKTLPRLAAPAVRAAGLLVRPGPLLCAAVLAGIALRCFAIESHELQYDEAATGYFSMLPWRDLWGSPAVLEPNPPLFYSLTWLVGHAQGTIEEMRWVSAVAGVLCIPLAWLIARDLAGGFAAAAAALLVAVSPQHIAISQYARAYALLILLVTCAFLCLVRARRPRPDDRRRQLYYFAGYAAAAAAALYTHHTAIVVVAALNLCVMLPAMPGAAGAGHAERRFLVQWLIANLVVAALYAPWAAVLFAQLSPAAAAPPSPVTAAGIAPLHWLWRTISDPYPFAGLPWIDLRLLPVIAFGAWRLRRSRDAAAVVAFVVLGLALMVVASRFRPLLDGKTLAWAGVFATIAAAIGCSAAGRFRVPAVVVAVVLALTALPTALAPRPEGWRAVAASLRNGTRAGDTLYMNYAAALLPLRHYGWSPAGVDVEVVASSDEEPWFRHRTSSLVAPQAAAADARARLAAGQRVFVVHYGTGPSGVAAAIAASSARVLHDRTGKLDLSLFLPMVPAD